MLGVAPVADMMPRMSETALENPVPPVADPVPVLAPIAPTTAPPSDAPTTQPAPEPADPTQVQAWLDAEKTWKWLDAETAWKTRFDPDWEHERVDFHGDYLAARKPTAAALTAVSLGTGKYIADQTRADFVGKFIELHLAPESYGQFLTRMMNPNENDYGDNAFGDLVKALSEETADELAASADKG